MAGTWAACSLRSASLGVGPGAVVEGQGDEAVPAPGAVDGLARGREAGQRGLLLAGGGDGVRARCGRPVGGRRRVGRAARGGDEHDPEEQRREDGQRRGPAPPHLPSAPLPPRGDAAALQSLSIQAHRAHNQSKLARVHRSAGSARGFCSGCPLSSAARSRWRRWCSSSRPPRRPAARSSIPASTARPTCSRRPSTAPGRTGPRRTPPSPRTGSTRRWRRSTRMRTTSCRVTRTGPRTYSPSTAGSPTAWPASRGRSTTPT